ncbi:Asp23/Gls24 family envelope stress response protein [Corynebacterium sp. CCUG 69979]|uniref:Asp23/Gls24 family envelope stress response protein n=1 Tax=unclassified Corynebacterium TaxID=2624378 RepID=UPI002108F4C1|nr:MULTISPECIES: Asp23/Gls24 family envelope stress response protein [unclassified Corynebacterium]MCQ4617615.1 Asp23/Gls24 family envelope stress response protein [Corynebacterium pseudogenitalium]MCQ4622472.1 Asp23/Gls24 family envelope stress response protein [Corynebacterium sp. CCUG 70398]MCQ4624045.1 Asp23/Gls24 family envelope stress response protein [Corynebacterium sp. CCUG 69979]
MDPDSYRISEKAVGRVAEAAVLTVPGTCAIDAKLAGLAGRSFPRVDAHIDRPSGAVALDVEMVTTYPAPVGAITDEVRQTVGTHVETLTGLTVTRINIAVADAEVSSQRRVTRTDLAHHPVGIVPAPVETTPSTVTSPVVKPQAELTPIVVDDSTYDQIAHVSTPPAPTVQHVSAPPAPSVRGVPQPPIRPLDPVLTPPPLPLAGIQLPQPPAPRSPVAPAPAPLRSITVTQFAPQRPITVTRAFPRKPVIIPPTEPLRQITVTAPARIAPVSLPARRPLDPIYAPKPQHVEVLRPEPQPLRRVGVDNPKQILVPQAPKPQALTPITVSPDNLEEESDG